MEKNKNQNNERQLKVYSKYHARSRKPLIVPEIRLCGNWLKEAGFNYGESVTVKHEQNKIIITTVRHA